MKRKLIVVSVLSIALLLIIGLPILLPSSDDAVKLKGEPSASPLGKPVENPAPSPSGLSSTIEARPMPTEAAPRIGRQPYSQQVEAALAGSDGQLAMDAVYAMERCESMDRLTESTFKQRDNTSDPKRRAAYALIAEEFQREQRSCQSLSESHKSRRNDLLKIANAKGVKGAGLRYLSQPADIIESDPEAKRNAVRNIQADARAGDRNSIILLGIEGENYQLPPETRWAFTAAATWIQRNDGASIAQVDDLMLTAFQLASMPADAPADVVQRVNATTKQLVDAYLANRKKP